VVCPYKPLLMLSVSWGKDRLRNTDLEDCCLNICKLLKCVSSRSFLYCVNEQTANQRTRSESCAHFCLVLERKGFIEDKF
jgi:hypothetical protein